MMNYNYLTLALWEETYRPTLDYTHPHTQTDTHTLPDNFPTPAITSEADKQILNKMFFFKTLAGSLLLCVS